MAINGGEISLLKKAGFQEKWAYWITAYPGWIVALVCVLVAASVPGLQVLEFKNDYRIYFGPENPQLQAYNSIQNIYSKSDNILFIVAPESGEVFSSSTLQAVRELTESAWQLAHSSRVDSITNFQHTVASGDELLVGDLVVAPAELSEQSREKIKQIALNEPLLVNRLISADARVTGVNVTVQLLAENAEESMALALQAQKLAATITAKYPGTKIYISGMVMMNNAFLESALHDSKTLVPAMYLILIVMLVLCLRSVSSTLAVVALIIISVVLTMGLTGWLGWYLTPTSAVAPTIILTMAVADCVHILVTMLHKLQQGVTKKRAIQESIRVNFQPIFLTSLTTAIGFLSMNFSDAPPFRDLGNIVAFGVILSWLLSITLLPALMMAFPVKIKKQAHSGTDLMRKLADLVVSRRKSLLILNGILAVVLISLAPRNELNDEFVKYFDQTLDFRKSTDFLNDNMGGIYTLELSVNAATDGGINEPGYLFRLEQLSRWLRSLPEVKHVNSLSDTFKRLNQNMHGDQPEWYRLPNFRELAAQYLLLYEMSLPYGLDLNDQVNINKSSVRIFATLNNMSSSQMLALEQKIKDWVRVNMPETKVDIASPILMFAHIGQRNIIGMIAGTVAALVLISVILIVVFRSVKLGLLSLIPNLIPAGIAFGAWALLDGTLGLGLSVVTGMTVGIVVDDTIHFISKYRLARIEKGMSSEAAVRYAFSTVGVAMLITSAVLVSGFLVLGLSHFTVNSGMGMMTAMTILIALFMDLLLLPPLLMTLDKINE